MKTFNEGDRVSHPTHGEGTVINPYDGTEWPTVQFDSGPKMMTHDSFLTPVPKAEPKFKIGDRVSHAYHPDGTVEETQANGVHLINIGGNRAYRALEHQIAPAVSEPKFNVRVLYTDSDGINSGVMYQQEAETFLTNFPSWDKVESITVTRVKGN